MRPGFLGWASKLLDQMGKAQKGNRPIDVYKRQTLNTLSVMFITLILSYFTLVLGELVPKQVAMKKSDAVARMASGVIRFLSIVLKPVVWFLSVSTRGVLRLMGINPNDEELSLIHIL